MEQRKLAEKIQSYIEGLDYVLRQIDKSNIREKEMKQIIDLAEKYFSDAKYYLAKKDYITSLVCIVYAEGLLDSLRFLNKIEYHWKFEKPEAKGRKVVIAGTFDLIHPGHLWLIKKASEYGKLTVIVARDKNVKHFKGHLPIIPEEQRLQVVKGLKNVDEAILGHTSGDILKIIEEIKPDILILGPDQNFISEEELKKELMNRGLKVEVIRIKNKYTSCRFFKTSDIIEEIKRRLNRDTS